MCNIKFVFLYEGQVILDKNSQIKTVVNKVNTIDETFRFFHMELLAGEDEMVTTTKEHGCSFYFDFSKVYWNSRLQSEHKRLVDTFDKTDVICDMFAGVGPFAIPAAKKGCVVYANDLNPQSFSSLKKNCQLNHVEKNVHCFNMDARDFMINLVKNSEKCNFDHVIMNLPATAVHFLDIFKGLFSHCSPNSSQKLPIIHCYCFSKEQNAELDAQQQVEAVLNKLEHCLVHRVRNVAPKKMMLCVSFPLPNSVAFENESLLSTARKNDEQEKGESFRMYVSYFFIFAPPACAFLFFQSYFPHPCLSIFHISPLSKPSFCYIHPLSKYFSFIFTPLSKFFSFIFTSLSKFFSFIFTHVFLSYFHIVYVFLFFHIHLCPSVMLHCTEYLQYSNKRNKLGDNAMLLFSYFYRKV